MAMNSEVDEECNAYATKRVTWRIRLADEVILKSSDIYSWERDEVSTAYDCGIFRAAV